MCISFHLRSRDKAQTCNHAKDQLLILGILISKELNSEPDQCYDLALPEISRSTY